jgi:phage-related protein
VANPLIGLGLLIAGLSEGQLAYGGYLFNVSWLLQDITYDNVMDGADIPFAPGVYSAIGKPGAKNFVLLGAIGGGIGALKDANNATMTTHAQAQAEIDRLMPLAYKGDLPLQWMIDRYTFSQMKQPKITYMIGNGYRTAAMTLEFVASDPRAYGMNVNTTAIAAGAGSTNLTNNGSYRNYPVITLTFSSTTTNPTIKVTSPDGAGYITIALTGTFLTTDTVVITCDPRSRSITKNGTANWGLVTLPFTNTFPATDLRANEVLPFLDPGVSPVLVTVGSGAGSASFSYQDTWI